MHVDNMTDWIQWNYWIFWVLPQAPDDFLNEPSQWVSLFNKAMITGIPTGARVYSSPMANLRINSLVNWIVKMSQSYAFKSKCEKFLIKLIACFEGSETKIRPKQTQCVTKCIFNV